MKRPGSGALTVLLAAAAWSLATGCAFFQDLSSDPYRSPDTGVNSAQCTGDGGCASLLLTCAGCSTGQACCLTLTPAGAASATCVAPSACASQGSFSFEFCESVDECEGGSCLEQTCTFGSTPFVVHACTKIPTCQMP